MADQDQQTDLEAEYARLQKERKVTQQSETETVTRRNFSAPREILADVPMDAHMGDDDAMLAGRKRTIAERESEYHARRRTRVLSPERADPFATKASVGDEARSYAEVMREAQLDRERHDTLRKLELQQRQREDASHTMTTSTGMEISPVEDKTPERAAVTEKSPEPKKKSQWDNDDDDIQPANKARSRWDETPVIGGHSAAVVKKRNRWDETPVGHIQPTPSRASRWDQTPLPGASATPVRKASRWDDTPVAHASSVGAQTPKLAHGQETPPALISAQAQFIQNRLDREMAERNKPWTDEDLNAVLPLDGYKILDPPEDYKPVRTAAHKLTGTPVHSENQDGFYFQDGATAVQHLDVPLGTDPYDDTLPLFKPDDVQYFGKLLEKRDENDMTLEEAKDRKIMRLLIRIKNGTPPMRKQAMKQITERARDFGAGPLFNHILPLLMSPTLEDQERHLLVKVIDRVLYKLDDLVRPYVHKILVVIEPLLIDEDYYARIEGREIISNLAKAAGLATMISTMRPDIDHVDEYVRNTTSRAFSVVASALGIPALLPFLKAVCKSKKSWQARHTGIKIVQQIAILMGCAILPHLRELVGIIAHGLTDENPKVRTMTALALSALAEASAPYGIESFDPILQSLWEGIRRHRGKGLAAFIKAVGFIIPLMDPEYANKYTKGIMPTLIREFQTPDEEMKKIVLRVIRQCAATDGIDGEYIRKDILPDYFKYFWVRRMALDRRNYRALVETTVELSSKVGVSEIVGRLVRFIKDESEAFRKMAIETTDKVIAISGTSDVDERLEELLIDGLLFAFQEHQSEDFVVLDAFGRISNTLGQRLKPHLPQVCSTILWRLNNKSAQVRQHAAELIARMANVLNECGEEQLLLHLGQVLYEYLGEEYPDVLASILAGLTGVVSVVGMTKMNPPIKDLLPRLTPVLKNRHEKVAENVIHLVGRIADRGPEHVSAREWMRICFELLELLKAHRKSIRRAAIKTFGYIAKAIVPQDVLATLLNNLKVQERQYRVCTTIAIAIVAETCAPFTVLPAMMNEYRVPELNVQNGILKSLAFMFEYIGEMSKDYVYAITPLLEDALIDRDLVHRQIACAAIKHLAVTCTALDREDALTHLMNLVWPNIFETTPHMVNACLEAIEGMRVALGPGMVLLYVIPGLFHPARKVREAYWRVYNVVYMGGQDAIVPFYPRILDDDMNTYSKHELDYVI